MMKSQIDRHMEKVEQGSSISATRVFFAFRCCSTYVNKKRKKRKKKSNIYISKQLLHYCIRQVLICVLMWEQTHRWRSGEYQKPQNSRKSVQIRNVKTSSKGGSGGTSGRKAAAAAAAVLNGREAATTLGCWNGGRKEKGRLGEARESERKNENGKWSEGNFVGMALLKRPIRFLAYFYKNEWRWAFGLRQLRVKVQLRPWQLSACLPRSRLLNARRPMTQLLSTC